MRREAAVRFKVSWVKVSYGSVAGEEKDCVVFRSPGLRIRINFTILIPGSLLVIHESFSCVVKSLTDGPRFRDSEILLATLRPPFRSARVNTRGRLFLFFHSLIELSLGMGMDIWTVLYERRWSENFEIVS